MAKRKPGPVRTYAVTVTGFGPLLYSARSAAKARARCYRDYCAAYDCTFSAFLCKSTVRRTVDPPGIGERMLVTGKPAIRVIGRGSGIYFMWDDGSDEILTAHPSEVLHPPAVASGGDKT